MFGGSTSLSIIDSMQQVVVDIRVYLLYLLLMVRDVDRTHICSNFQHT